MKSNIEDFYLNIKQCILILLKNYTIWSHNLVLLLLKKRTLFSKIPAVSAHESKSGSCSSELSLQALVWAWWPGQYLRSKACEKASLLLLAPLRLLLPNFVQKLWVTFDFQLKKISNHLNKSKLKQNSFSTFSIQKYIW